MKSIKYKNKRNKHSNNFHATYEPHSDVIKTVGGNCHLVEAALKCDRKLLDPKTRL